MLVVVYSNLYRAHVELFPVAVGGGGREACAPGGILRGQTNSVTVVYITLFEHRHRCRKWI